MRLTRQRPERAFDRALMETVSWCAPRASTSEVSNCLRTPALQPSALKGLLRPSLRELLAPGRFKAAVDRLSKDRRRLLAQLHVLTGDGAPSDAGGRILVVSPNDAPIDGASEAASSGFFDAVDLPPWDTWIAYDAYCLFSWVPPALTAFAQAGMDVNVSDCQRWTEGSSVASICRGVDPDLLATLAKFKT
jgi:hypothetical protein